MLEALIVMKWECCLIDMQLKVLPGDWQTQRFNQEEFDAFARSCGPDDLVHDPTAKGQRNVDAGAGAGLGKLSGRIADILTASYLLTP